MMSLPGCRCGRRRSGAEHAVQRRSGPARTGVPSAREGPGLWSNGSVVDADVVDQAGEESSRLHVLAAADVKTAK